MTAALQSMCRFNRRRWRRLQLSCGSLGENMRASVLLGSLLVFGPVAYESAAQPADIHCPTPGTRLTYSNGGRIEAVSDQGNYVCRFRSLATQTTFDRYFGARGGVFD